MSSATEAGFNAPTVGQPFAGGFFAGRMRIGADVYALIVAPKADGETELRWDQGFKDVPQACSFGDGASNTCAMSEAGIHMAKWAQALSIGGHVDWYIPSLDELELIYRNLKPTSADNWCYLRSGMNQNSEPVGLPYTKDFPKQTEVEAFRKGGAQALEERSYWASTQYCSGDAWNHDGVCGSQLHSPKNDEEFVRAVRRVKLIS